MKPKTCCNFSLFKKNASKCWADLKIVKHKNQFQNFLGQPNKLQVMYLNICNDNSVRLT